MSSMPEPGSWRPASAKAAPSAEWSLAALVDDMAPILAALVAQGERFALVTVVARNGGPRPVGSQMIVSADRAWGFVSGGCVEADVAVHARAALDVWQPRRLIYGHGSPFFDIRLPCGGYIELLVEPIRADDPAMVELLGAMRERRAVRYLSDGVERRCVNSEVHPGALADQWIVDRVQAPCQRLVVVGRDPYALAIAMAGCHQGWEVTLVSPGGPTVPPPADMAYRRDAPDLALRTIVPDPWTAVAVASHDADLDHVALLAALRSGAGYVGILGSRRRLGERLARLDAAGTPSQDIARLHAPIGLPIAAHSPHEVALAVVAEIVDARERSRPQHGLSATGQARQSSRPTLGGTS